MNLKEAIKWYKEDIDKSLTYYIPKDTPETLAESMKYSLIAGGKRIRPILLLMVCDHYKVKREISLPLAVSIEYIHTYSLIHDDLPAMDNDDYRRGKPTNHKIFGEALAILAGDALLTQAFDIASNIKGLDPLKKVEIVKILAQAAGAVGMIKGQVLDIENEGKILSEEKLFEIHENKTGKLLLAPLLISAILCDFNEKEKRAIENYGKYLGLTFQITDDILDVCGQFEEMGKMSGSDEKLSKATYVTIKGLEEAEKLAKHYSELGAKALKDCDLDLPYLFEIINYLLNRKS